ncbi:expressed unknown protein [Seminavis robusta]|uniref:Uncharacterized protein n=1 Tax=Seminavis robusta TaxID=568900 RepID=A0A9N8EUF7_9STRA|nr:expressed unknown protein [Seminavis robusta]|eukprot:Sro1795_g298000.1 n/a (116) ;mRNA; r:3083-3430
MDGINIDTTRNNNGYYNESAEGTKAASTFDTQATTPCSVISTPPAKKHSFVFQTPDGPRIKLASYEEACLSPTLPVDVDVATAKMEDDKILLDPFVHGLEPGPRYQRVFRCLLYL